jgi:putative FmdB family regulatory protein
MPTYEYVCEKCGHHFEQFQSITASPLKVCPKEFCQRKRWGKGKVKRKLSAGAGLLFKGSGFYITDYRSESYKQAAKKDTPAPAASSSESKASKPTAEAKPAKAAAKSTAK